MLEKTIENKELNMKDGFIDVMIRMLSIIYRESVLSGGNGKSDISSRDLILNVLKYHSLTNKEVRFSGNGDSEILSILKECINNLLSEDKIDKVSYLETLRTSLKTHKEVYDIIKVNADTELTDKETLTLIKSHRSYLNRYYILQKAKRQLSAFNMKLFNNEIKPNEVNGFIENVMSSLDTLTVNLKNDDPAVTGAVDLFSGDGVESVIDAIKDEKVNGSKLRCGWSALNTASDEFRRGTMHMLNALQHSYKSGLIASLFAQFCQFNKPNMIDPSKKPAIVMLGLEDDLQVTLLFLYNYLYYDEFETNPDLINTDPAEIKRYIIEKLTVNGYHPIIQKVDPTQWSYKDLFAWLMKLEAEGYEIHALLIDYLSLIPTTGCITTGAMGTDLRDLYRRVRNFGLSRKILIVTPHQLSTEAKQLLRHQIKDMDFPKEIVGKGYFSNSKQLDQEVDVEWYFHKARFNKRWMLVFQRGKNRGAPILEDNLLYFGLYFPKGMPIPSDINGNRGVTWYENKNGTDDDDGLDF